jgi:transposase-like protein
MSGKKGMKDYPAEVKLEAVRMYLEEGKTRRAIIEELGINDVRQVTKWLAQYRKFGSEVLIKRKPTRKEVSLGRPPKAEAHARYFARLEMENALLKKFHTELREVQLAQRNIGRSTTTGKHTK